MKTTGHGIDDSRDVANVYHLRLMTLLQELVRDKGYHGAGRVLEIDQKTVTESARTGVLTRRVRQALERAVQEGVGSVAARQRERNDRLEERLRRLEQDHEALGKEARRRLAAVEGQVGGLRGSEDRGGPGSRTDRRRRWSGEPRLEQCRASRSHKESHAEAGVSRPGDAGACERRCAGVRRRLALGRRVARDEGFPPHQGQGAGVAE